jgi:hypothetical protein
MMPAKSPQAVDHIQLIVSNYIVFNRDRISLLLFITMLPALSAILSAAFSALYFPLCPLLKILLCLE